VSLTADALAVLEGWRAPNDAQEALRARYADHVRSRPDPLSRSGRPDHLTASTLVLSGDRSRVLLTLHAKAGRWFQLGGHCEPGDATLAGAATREAREESGIATLTVDPVPVQLSEHAVPFCGSSTGPDGRERPVRHLDVRFVAVVPPGARHAVSDESLDLRWWPVDALPDPETDLLDLVRLALARLAPVR